MLRVQDLINLRIHHEIDIQTLTITAFVRDRC
jgi:hypothetical protein